MMIFTRAILLIFSVLLPAYEVAGFFTTALSCTHARSLSRNMSMEEAFASAVLENREFQLEEMEDKDSAATSIILNADGSVTLGSTDGPLPLSASGKWSLNENVFNMEITREFESIESYEVSRKYAGEIEEVMTETDVVILAGEMLMNDFSVGFFKMISNPADITSALESADERIKIPKFN